MNDNLNFKAHNEARLRGCQLKELYMLNEFKKICERHNLTYWLDAGTLLGAIRHKGFIPWDDDVDIVMPSADYKKFLQVAPSELPDDLFCQTKLTDPTSPFEFTKLRDLNSLFISRVDDFTKPYKKGIWIDIFEMVDCPNLPLPLMRLFHRKLSGIYFTFQMNGKYSWTTLIRICRIYLGLFILKPLWNVLSLCKKKKGKYMSFYHRYNGNIIFHKKDEIFPLTDIEFEGGVYKAPKNTDFYLREQYGDYMKLPPLEQRGLHVVYIDLNVADGKESTA